MINQSIKQTSDTPVKGTAENDHNEGAAFQLCANIFSSRKNRSTFRVNCSWIFLPWFDVSEKKRPKHGQILLWWISWTLNENIQVQVFPFSFFVCKFADCGVWQLHQFQNSLWNWKLSRTALKQSARKSDYDCAFRGSVETNNSEAMTRSSDGSEGPVMDRAANNRLDWDLKFHLEWCGQMKAGACLLMQASFTLRHNFAGSQFSRASLRKQAKRNWDETYISGENVLGEWKTLLRMLDHGRWRRDILSRVDSTQAQVLAHKTLWLVRGPKTFLVTRAPPDSVCFFHCVGSQASYLRKQHKMLRSVWFKATHEVYRSDNKWICFEVSAVRRMICFSFSPQFLQPYIIHSSLVYDCRWI